MTKRPWDNDTTDIPSATIEAPGISVTKSKKPWDDDKVDNPTAPAQKKKFIPSIGGASKEAGDVRDWIGSIFGGSVTRGIPGVKHLIPLSQTDQKMQEQFPTMEKVGNFTGNVMGALPTAGVMPGGLLANMAAQGGINAGVGVADKLIETKGDTTPGELGVTAGVNAAGGAFGPMASKIISPFQHYPHIKPSPDLDMKIANKLLKGKTVDEQIANMRGSFKTIQDNKNKANAIAAKHEGKVHKWQTRVDDVAEAFNKNPVSQFVLPTIGGLAGHQMGGGNMLTTALGVGAGMMSPPVMKGYIGNQMMGPTTQDLLNAMLRGSTTSITGQ